MPCGYRHGKIVEYIIYDIINGSEIHHDAELPTQRTFHNLTPDTPYTFTIIAKNSAGRSIPGMITASTLSGKYAYKVSQQSIYCIGSNHITRVTFKLTKIDNISNMLYTNTKS